MLATSTLIARIVAFVFALVMLTLISQNAADAIDVVGQDMTGHWCIYADGARTYVQPCANFGTEIRGRVIDSVTGQGVSGVCLFVVRYCDAESDASGYWRVSVGTGAYWDVQFEKAAYRTARIRVFAGGPSINIGNVRLSRFPI